MRGTVFSAASRFAGRQVLAARGDDELLLAIDDPQVAVVIDLTDVARVQPAVGIDGLGGLLGVVQVADADEPAAAAHLAVGEDLQLHPGQRLADRTGLDLEALEGHGSGVLTHPVHLGEWDADGAEPGDQLRRDRARRR